jgi:hypothetical protein
LLIWLAAFATAVLAVSMLAALAGLMLSALTWILRLLARLVLAAALLLAGFLLAATLLMLGIVGVLRHGQSPLKPCPGNLLSFQLWPSCGRNVETDYSHIGRI